MLAVLLAYEILSKGCLQGMNIDEDGDFQFQPSDIPFRLTEPNFLQQLLAPGSENSSIIQNQDPEISVSAVCG